ncbi:MAG: hypothetical protein ABIO92_11080 [Chloroflexia bacterium]
MIGASRSLLGPVAALAGLAVLLVVILFVGAALSAPAPITEPAAQGPKPRQGRFGSTGQNNASAYMESYGYKVDAVGLPKKADGSLDEDSVVMLMPVQSPQFDPDKRTINDSGTIKQVSQGLIACKRSFPKASKIAVGLEWGESIVMFPAQAAILQALQDGKISTTDLWLQVEPNIVVIDATAWQPLYDTNFISKDFSGDRDLDRGLPPDAERLVKRQGQIRLQTSTAYLPTGSGSKAALIATISDNEAKPLSSTNVEFTFTQQGQDPQLVTSSATGNDGAARASLQAPPQAQGQLTIRATTSDTLSIASVPILVGPPVTGTEAINAIVGSLRLQGFNVLNVFPEEAQSAGGTAVKGASIIAEIGAPRLDARVRGQILSMAGTVFAIYGEAETAAPVLIYRSQGRPYELIFQVARREWDNWIDGTISEAQLWERIPLDRIIDAETGQPIAQRDFINKNFGTDAAAFEISTPKAIESNLVRESWGDQLYSGKLIVPVGAVADSFEVASRAGQAEFAIFASTDPVEPLYRSVQDISNGSGLRQLSLVTGQYTLSVEGNAAPASVRLAYIEHLAGSGELTR